MAAAYQPVPRSSTSSEGRGPASPVRPPRGSAPAAKSMYSSAAKSMSVKTRTLFRIDALVCCITAITCLAAGTHGTRHYHSAPYTQSLIVVFVALGLSLLSQLVALAFPFVLRDLHVNVAWKGKDWNAVEMGSVIRLPPAARQRRRSLGAVLGNGLLGSGLVVGGLVFTIIAQLRMNPPVAVVGEAFCFWTGFVHLCFAFLPTKHLHARLLFAITLEPAEELGEEPKSPAVYQDVEEFPALDI
ncbi:hypothetical protein MMC27_001792 [Xylographa pallens]|nr:hypothetical protein [Xylographa pallens]